MVTAEALLQKVRGLRNDGWRLVQVGATRLPEQVELTYSFGFNGDLQNLRVALPATAPRVPSITSVYWGAFLYENELHDLFNIQVDGIAVDFHGALYRTTIKFPFGSTKPPQVEKQSPAGMPARPVGVRPPAKIAPTPRV
jgi:ech hydrogenase subunit D